MYSGGKLKTTMHNLKTNKTPGTENLNGEWIRYGCKPVRLYVCFANYSSKKKIKVLKSCQATVLHFCFHFFTTQNDFLVRCLVTLEVAKPFLHPLLALLLTQLI